MAGPWFTVYTIGADWKTMDSIWMSDGARSFKARIQGKVRLTALTAEDLEQARAAAEAAGPASREKH